MKKLLLIILCTINTTIHAAEPPLSDYYKLNSLLSYAKKWQLTDAQIKTKLEECSNQGNKYCSSVLGVSYYREKNYDEAFSYLTKSDCKFKTINGKEYWPSSSYLGVMYFKGWGTEKNYEKSIEYFKQCALTGESGCAFMVAGVYTELYFKTHDLVPSNAWIKVAKKMGMTEIEGPKNANVDITDAIEFMQESLTPEEIQQSDLLANQICAIIPECKK